MDNDILVNDILWLDAIYSISYIVWKTIWIFYIMHRTENYSKFVQMTRWQKQK